VDSHPERNSPERNGTEQNRTERNRTQRNRTENGSPNKAADAVSSTRAHSHHECTQHNCQLRTLVCCCPTVRANANTPLQLAGCLELDFFATYTHEHLTYVLTQRSARGGRKAVELLALFGHTAVLAVSNSPPGQKWWDGDDHNSNNNPKYLRLSPAPILLICSKVAVGPGWLQGARFNASSSLLHLSKRNRNEISMPSRGSLLE